MTTPSPDPGSFRDPLSRVYLDGDRVLRGLTADADQEFTDVEQAPFFARALGQGRLIPTRRVDATLIPDHTFAAVLEHPRLDVWTYPYEWTFSMLRDAALAQLDLQLMAIADGFACKDATPYNLQFQNLRPVFIDIGSFERYNDGDPWYGYLQFCQLFLYPLLLQAHADIAFHPLLRGSIDGITPETAWKMLGPTRLARKGVPLHVAAHARAQKQFADTSRDVKSDLKASGFNASMVEANVRGLRKVIEGLSWKRSVSTWSDYSDRGHYTGRDLDAKERFVKDAAGRRHHRLAWDIGCNDGRFSRLIAQDADQVLAFDGDHVVVDVLYRALLTEGVTNVTPLVLDIADPSPGVGWAGGERRGFIERCTPDLVLALAVVHHVTISSNVPFDVFLDLLRSFDATVVIEFPTEHDPMVQRLVRNKRKGIHADYTLENFDAAVRTRFEVVHQSTLETRVLYELRPG